ncbi:MAG: hypothetical protein EOO46_22390, partial [Flavobacterium sp.]
KYIELLIKTFNFTLTNNSLNNPLNHDLVTVNALLRKLHLSRYSRYLLPENNNACSKLIGMPVPGTGTAVWWETQIDPTLVFGIPMVATIGKENRPTENLQLEPDIKVPNDFKAILSPMVTATGIHRNIILTMTFQYMQPLK